MRPLESEAKTYFAVLVMLLLLQGQSADFGLLAVMGKSSVRLGLPNMSPGISWIVTVYEPEQSAGLLFPRLCHGSNVGLVGKSAAISFHCPG